MLTHCFKHKQHTCVWYVSSQLDCTKKKIGKVSFCTTYIVSQACIFGLYVMLSSYVLLLLYCSVLFVLCVVRFSLCSCLLSWSNKCLCVSFRSLCCVIEWVVWYIWTVSFWMGGLDIFELCNCNHHCISLGQLHWRLNGRHQYAARKCHLFWQRPRILYNISSFSPVSKKL